RVRVVKLDGEDDELVLARQPHQHAPVAASDRVGRNDLVVKDGDAHVLISDQRHVILSEVTDLIRPAGFLAALGMRLSGRRRGLCFRRSESTLACGSAKSASARTPEPRRPSTGAVLAKRRAARFLRLTPRRSAPGRLPEL